MKKKLLTVMVTTLLLVTLVGCGKDTDTISDSTQENEEVENEVVEDEEVENEEVEDEADSETTEEGFMDTSMDGGAPVGETFDGATTEETTTEEVVPVEVTFTLMSEDGSAVAFEGTVPEGLTLVSGDGTNHIEFSYDENPAVTVCLDGGADNNVLVANEYDVIQLTPQYLENNTLGEATEPYQIASGYHTDLTTNGIAYTDYFAYQNHLFYAMGENENVDYRTFVCDCHGAGNSEGYVVDPNSDEFGYITWKLVALEFDGTLLDNPFTITVRMDQPEVGSVSNDEMNATNDSFTGSKGIAFAINIMESFSN